MMKLLFLNKSLFYLLTLGVSLSLATPVKQCGVNFRFANYYGSTMVLQHAPASAVVWGYAFNVGDSITVTINVGGEDRIYTSTAADGAAGSPIWSVTLDPIDAGGPYVISASSADCELSLTDVLFGDVYICSGQSNMDHRMDQLDDPEEDIADSVNYPNIRTVFSTLTTAETPQEDVQLDRNWAIPNEVDIAAFSAVCWLYGVRLYQRLQIPIGLIKSSWGGTRIEAWSSPEALNVCFPDGVDEGSGANAASALYNSMIHPYMKMPIYGAIWYQGESNQGNYDDYACAQHEMVEDWRQSWFSNTGSTDPTFPFGVVQLAPSAPASTNMGFPRIRWAQTGGVGYLPTEYFEKFFMAVAIDLPDFDSPHGAIHPRYKRQIADRLAIAAFPVAYGLDLENRYQGPFPTSFAKEGSSLTITFDDGNTVLEGRDLETSNAFQVCCSIDSSTFCVDTSGDWQAAPITAIDGASVTTTIPCATEFITGVRYAWSESPCPNLEQCALYSTDGGYSLPAPPFTHDGYIP